MSLLPFEKQVKKVTKVIGISPFKIGSRRAFTRVSFESNFDKFVEYSARETNAQTERRIKGALTFNDKIDAIFAYIDYANRSNKFAYEECVEYLKSYDEERYSKWDDEVLRLFIQSRGTRNKG